MDLQGVQRSITELKRELKLLRSSGPSHRRVNSNSNTSQADVLETEVMGLEKVREYCSITRWVFTKFAQAIEDHRAAIESLPSKQPYPRMTEFMVCPNQSSIALTSFLLIDSRCQDNQRALTEAKRKLKKIKPTSTARLVHY